MANHIGREGQGLDRGLIMARPATQGVPPFAREILLLARSLFGDVGLMMAA